MFVCISAMKIEMTFVSLAQEASWDQQTLSLKCGCQTYRYKIHHYNFLFREYNHHHFIYM